MKKKYLMRLSILCFLFLFVCYGCTYASWSIDEFERKTMQVYNQITDASYNYKNIFNSFLNSNVYATTKNDIPFDQYDKLFVGFNGGRLNIYLTNDTVNGYINSNGQFIANVDLHVWVTSYDYDSRYSSFSLRNGFPISDLTYTANYNNYLLTTPNFSGSNWFTIFFTNDVITNQYNYTIYGFNYTLSTPVYNGTTNVDIGEYYRLCRGFVGSYYYNEYQNLEYKILKNDSSEYVGTKNVYYTPDVNGQVVDIYFYVEQSMNNLGFKVVTYYNDEIVYQESAFNTLVINSGGSSSGDSGGGGSSIDLTDTNNLIIGLGNTIISGDEMIANTIRSGDASIVNAIVSGERAIIGTVLDHSQVNNYLSGLASSGESGEQIARRFLFHVTDTEWATLIYKFFDGVCDILKVRDNTGWHYTIGTTSYTLYPSQFDVLPTPLKVFVCTYLIFMIIFVLYNSLRKTIDLFTVGEYKTGLDSLEVDTNYIYM